ncbi:MAG: hypothetical protein M0P69_19600 [Bacteroidales bacterium]|nr:hypothetical protein [Bacteroidales bacterium]
MEIKLDAKKEKAVRETAADMARVKGISEEQAIRELLGLGLTSWWEMQDRQRQAVERQTRKCQI